MATSSRPSNSREGDISRSELNRPRRPNPDTITYLKSLPLDVETARQEISNFLNADNDETRVEFPAMLAAALSALDEIRLEVASLAGDESGAEILEILVKITAPCSLTASYVWLESLRGYAHHLALHRYGSHVLQSILEQIFIAKPLTEDKQQDDLARHPDSPMEATTIVSNEKLCNLFEELQQELLPFSSQLTTHLCATHVLRTLFLIFGGIEYVTTEKQQQLHRGQSKKKKKPQDTENATLPQFQINYISNNRRLARIDSMNKLLDDWTDIIAPGITSSQQPGELQQLACHASGGPLLMVLLRSLTYRDVPSSAKDTTAVADPSFKSLGKLLKEPRFKKGSKACFLTKRILCWNDEDAKDEADQKKSFGDVIYGLAGETRGSHLLDTILRLCYDDMHAQILQLGQFGVASVLQEYVEHTVSNFVVQTLLATARTSETAHQMTLACLPLISSGLIVHADKRRRGILWRLAELAVQYKSEQAALFQALKDSDHCSSLKQLPLLMLDPKRGSERIVLNVEGSRALYYFLHFQCPGADDVVAGVLGLPVDDLDALARDGLGSRVVWDALLQQQQQRCRRTAKNDESSSSTLWYKTGIKLLHKLKGHWVALATDRVGHHVVLNLFRTLPKDEARVVLVQELVEARHRLQGNSMGRTIMTECAVDVYKNQGVVEWRKVIQKHLEQQEWLENLESSRVGIGTTTTDIEVLPRDGGKEVTHKRKHKNNSSRHNSSSEPDPVSKRTKKGDMTLDSIFDALTVPKK